MRFDRPISECSKQLDLFVPPLRFSKETMLLWALYVPTQNTFGGRLFPWGSLQRWDLAAQTPKWRWRLGHALVLAALAPSQASSWEENAGVAQGRMEKGNVCRTKHAGNFLLGEAGIKTAKRFWITRASPNSECGQGRADFELLSAWAITSEICFPWNTQVQLEQWLESTFCKERFCFILKGCNTLKYFPMEMTLSFCWYTREPSHHSFHPSLALSNSAGGIHGATCKSRGDPSNHPIQGHGEPSKQPPWAQLMETPILVWKMEGKAYSGMCFGLRSCKTLGQGQQSRRKTILKCEISQNRSTGDLGMVFKALGFYLTGGGGLFASPPWVGWEQVPVDPRPGHQRSTGEKPKPLSVFHKGTEGKQVTTEKSEPCFVVVSDFSYLESSRNLHPLPSSIQTKILFLKSFISRRKLQSQVGCSITFSQFQNISFRSCIF